MIVRFLRSVRYTLYQPPSGDSKGFLGNREYECDLTPIDFAKVAEGFGIAGLRADVVALSLALVTGCTTPDSGGTDEPDASPSASSSPTSGATGSAEATQPAPREAGVLIACGLGAAGFLLADRVFVVDERGDERRVRPAAGRLAFTPERRVRRHRRIARDDVHAQCRGEGSREATDVAEAVREVGSDPTAVGPGLFVQFAGFSGSAVGDDRRSQPIR